MVPYDRLPIPRATDADRGHKSIVLYGVNRHIRVFKIVHSYGARMHDCSLPFLLLAYANMKLSWIAFVGGFGD